MSSNYKGPLTSFTNRTTWNSTHTTVFNNSSWWGANATDIMALAAASGGWNSTQSTVNTNSSKWVSVATTLSSISFAGSTIVNVVTGTGEFITLTINGSAYALELYIY